MAIQWYQDIWQKLNEGNRTIKKVDVVFELVDAYSI